MGKVKKLFPNCNFHLVCIDAPYFYKSFNWMKEFEPYKDLITKLVVETSSTSNLEFKDFLHFSNLESLDLSTYNVNLESDFRQKMPNLQNLKLKYMSMRDWKYSMNVSHTF